MPLRHHPLLMESPLRAQPPPHPSTTPHRTLQPQQFSEQNKKRQKNIITENFIFIIPNIMFLCYSVF